MADSSVFKIEPASYNEILKKNQALASVVTGNELTIHVLNNVTVNPLKEILECAVRLAGVPCKVEFGNYDNIIQDSYTLGDPDILIVFFELINLVDGFEFSAELSSAEELHRLFEKCKSDIDILFQNLASKSKVVFNLFHSYAFTGFHFANRNIDVLSGKLNEYVLANKPDNFEIVDISRVIAYCGVSKTFDRQKYIKYKSLYTIDFFKHYVSALENILRSRTGKLKKALVFDCDNTLWKGIIGEDGIEGIEMSEGTKYGTYFKKVQELIVELSKKGILIALCSKNNREDVMSLMGGHPDMLISEEHIVAAKINWNSKDQNLRELAEELNIGLDSFVFFDDSKFELNLISSQLPEVLTVAVPDDISTYPALVLETAQRYFNLQPLKDDLRKVTAYKEQAKRTEAMKSFTNINDYLKTLETQVRIDRNDFSQIARVAQLTQKTNQFNLTTKRYSEADIKLYMESDVAEVFTITVSDKFGTSGLTGAAIVKKSSVDFTAEFDSLLLSCRVLGRQIEDAFLNYIIEFLREEGFKHINAAYIKTAKNAQVADFYLRHQFKAVSVLPDRTIYGLNADEYTARTIGFITITDNTITA
jgi:FkbH-like protein